MMQLIINGVLADGVIGDVVMTFSSDNLSSIITKNGSYSNTFELEITNNNQKIFESAEVVISVSGNTYKKLSCQIVVDGLEVVNGFCVLKSSKKSYSLSVFSGNSSFNNAIKEFDLIEIKPAIDSLDHSPSVGDVVARRFNKTDIVYPNIDYGFFEYFTGFLNVTPEYFFFYSVYVKYIFQKIVEKLGYQLVGNLWESEVYQNLAIPCGRVIDTAVFNLSASLAVARNEYYGYNKYFSFSSVDLDESNSYNFVTIPILGALRGYSFFEPPVNNAIVLTLKGKFTLFNISQFDTTRFDIELRIVNKNTGVIKGTVYGIQFTAFAANSFFTKRDFTLDEVVFPLSNLNLIDHTTDVLVWYMQRTPNSFNAAGLSDFRTTEDFEWSFKNELPNTDLQNRVYDSLPSFKASELYQSILALEGAFVIVDEYTKTIQSVYYEEIKNNIGNAYDWSDLLDLTEEPEISYRFKDYGQKNIFKYKNDEDDVYLNRNLKLGEGYLQIDDTTLESTKEVLEIPFSTCSIGTTANGNAVMAKIYTGEKYVLESGVYNIDPNAKIEKFKARIVKLVDSSSSAIRILNVNTGSREVSNSIYLDKIVNKRYTLFKDITNNTKIVKALFRLKVNDIQGFDFRRPVYVSYFSEYFFVNEITQFKFNEVQSTEVELIRL
jgi:hypothetical protein